MADFRGISKIVILLAALPEQLAARLRQLISYDKESAGGLMTTDYIALSADMKGIRIVVTRPQIPPLKILNQRLFQYPNSIEDRAKAFAVLDLHLVTDLNDCRLIFCASLCLRDHKRRQKQ